MSRIRLHARRGEDGAALPMALAFLILCALMTSIIIDYTGVGNRMASKLATERNDVYTATGAIDAAIKYAQVDPSRPVVLGSDANNACANPGTPFLTTTVNGTPVTVTCSAAPGSGDSGGTTTAPNFAILTLAPYHGAAPNGGGSFPNCVNTHDELGIVQVQKSKLLQIYGNVYVNSDADADLYDSNGCPSTLAALPMVVYGNVVERESNHDFCAGPTNVGDPQCNPYINAGGPPLPSPQGTAPYTDTAPLANPTTAQSALLADPGLPANDPAGMWQPDFLDPPAAGVITDEHDNVITSCPPANPTTGYRLIHFSHGTYRNVAVLNGFTNGACPNAVLWFEPGDYYFDFTDAGTASSTLHQWTINDTGVRIVGGQPFVGPSQSPTLFSSTWKPTVASTSGFVNAQTSTSDNGAAAEAIDGQNETATINSGKTATLTVSTFKSSAGTAIPPDAQINSVRLRVAHGAANTALLQAPTVTITPGSGGAACTALQVTPRQGSPVEDPAPNYSVFNVAGTNCLNDVSKINDAMKLTYSVSHCAPVTGACTSAPATDSVDGIWLDITYTTGGRLAWNPSDPTTITPAAPTVPGACLSDRDSKQYGWSDGVQFVFGGDSHVQLKSGKVELCDKRSATKQEITLYGVRSTKNVTPTSSTWQPSNFVNGANPFTNGVNAELVDGASATAALSSSTTTRTITMTQFAPSTWPIPAASQIPTNATINSVELDVTHGGTNSRSGSTTNAVTNPTLTVSSGSTTCPTATLANHTNVAATGADLVNLTSCLNSPALLNAGVNALFTARRSSGSPTESLDGMQLKISYTAPAPSTGTLSGETGCVTQAPYYTPPTPGVPAGSASPAHEPGYNGACALIQVATDSAGGSFPRVLTLWGTAYAPSAALDVPVDVMTVPVFNRGVVARMMMLGYNIANNAIVPITTTPNAGVIYNNREMVLTATVGTSTVTADVKVCDYPDADQTAADACTSGSTGGADPPVKVLSWRTTR